MVGTYGWEDGTGLLRYTDYIADHRGYRLVGTRTSYISHEDREREDGGIEDSVGEDSVNTILDNHIPGTEPVLLNRKLIKRKRARKRNTDHLSAVDARRLARRLGVAEPVTGDRGQAIDPRADTEQELFQDERQFQEPLSFQEPLPFQEPLLLANQYPRNQPVNKQNTNMKPMKNYSGAII